MLRGDVTGGRSLGRTMPRKSQSLSSMTTLSQSTLVGREDLGEGEDIESYLMAFKKEKKNKVSL